MGKKSDNGVEMFVIGAIFIILLIFLVVFVISYTQQNDQQSTQSGNNPVINWWKKHNKS